MVCWETTEPAQLLLLPVKRQRKHIFAVHDLRQQTGRYDPAARQKRGRNGAFLHGNTGFLFFALTPAPGFASLLDRRPAFRAFVDRCVRAVPLRVVVPHPAFAVGAFLPRDVARWRKAHPAVQACQLIRHEAILLVCFFHFTTLGKVHDYLTLTSAWSKEAQKEKEKCESGQDLTEEICAVAEAVIPT